jgi:hypothetical protein
MKTWEERVSGAASALGYSDVKAFEEELSTKIGITQERGGIQALDNDEIFKFGDFREAFKGPIAPLRMAFKALREGQQAKADLASLDPRVEQLKALGVKLKLEDVDIRTLLTLYDASKPGDPITEALKKRFGTKPIIAFREDGSVAIEEVVQYVSDLEQGFPEQTALKIDGVLTMLWPVGRTPHCATVEEDPLFPGKPLRRGCSVVNNRNWSNIPHAVRVLCRIIVERGEINPDNREAVLRLMERAAQGTLVEAYPEADLEYRERSRKLELPKLQIELSSLIKPNNPFGVRRQY